MCRRNVEDIAREHTLCWGRQYVHTHRGHNTVAGNMKFQVFSSGEDNILQRASKMFLQRDAQTYNHF